MRRRVKRWGVVVAVIAVLVVAWTVNHRRNYPYGWSHCCDKSLWMALLTYADTHDGWFPRGEATPEASLSLLHRVNPDLVDANLLRGKTIPEAAVRARLEAGELLSPETCGWHYVEGLRMSDDHRLALFWDKVGLGHNGQQLPDGRHEVWLLSGMTSIPAAEWEQFLAAQQQLRAAIRR